MKILFKYINLIVIMIMVCSPNVVLAKETHTRAELQELGIKSKIDYHNYLAEQRGSDFRLEKPRDAFDRKRSILNVGNVEARIRNSGTLGYDRDGKCYEFPAGGGITYRWTMAPLVGAKIDGEKWVACGTLGAARAHEDEFQPIGGLDAGWSDVQNNYGIAASDRPDTWPSSWPTDQLMPTIGEKGFPGILDGKVVGTRELYFAVTDAQNNTHPNTIRIDMWGIQYEDFINEDFIIYKMIVTNISDKTLNHVYIGMHDDPDTPEQGTAEWTDDFAAFISQGTDVEGYSSAQDSLLWDFSYLWDGDDRVEGLIPSKVGWVGLKVLETPANPAIEGQNMGLTTLDVFEYSMAPQTDITEYDQLAAGIMEPQNVTPHPEDYTQSPNTYGPDITYVLASGPFTLLPGGQLNFALASVHGVNKRDLFNNAMLCQILYNEDYKAAESPPEPAVTATAGDHSVTLYWNSYPTEDAVYYDAFGEIDHIGDKLTGNNAFEGYQIYKSMDRGLTWGDPIINVTGSPMGYIPIAQYDIPNGVAGESETRPFFYLGDDTGLKHTYIDNNVNNGYEYWYAVLAYDRDDGPIPPLANAFKKDASFLGDNVVAVVPSANVSGFIPGSTDTLITHSAGSSDGIPYLKVVNPGEITGDSYEITFNVSNGAGKIASGRSISKIMTDMDLESIQSITGMVESFTVTNTTTGKVAVAGYIPVEEYPFYDDILDNAPIFDGIRLMVPPVSMGWKSAQWTTGSPDADFYLYASWGGYYNYMTTDDYEFRWTGTPGALGVYGASGIPFDIYNLTQDAACSHYMWDDDEDGAYSHWDRVMVVEPDGGWTWVFRFWPNEEPAAGDVYTVITNKPYFAEDKYQFSTAKETYSNVIEDDLKNITTVPNPFVVSSRFEIGKYGTEKQIQFHHLPPECTIRIYNIAGDFIREIKHDNGTPIETWNLQTYNEQEVAFGVYFYHVNVPNIGEYIGKMAIIK